MQQQESTGRVRVSQPAIYVIVALIGWLLSSYASYAAASSAMNARVSVLESQFQQIRGDISDIRNDVKTLLSRGDRK